MSTVLEKYFNISLVGSLLIHALVFSSFIRVIKEPAEEFTREIPSDSADSAFTYEEYVDYELFESMLAPYMDSTVIESLWQTDSLSIKKWSPYTESKPPEFDPAWYDNIYERSRELRDLLEKYRQRPDMDSLLAQSEFLRESVMKQILKHLNDSLLQRLKGEMDWKKIISNLAELLKKEYGSGTQERGVNRRLFSRMVNDPELMKLWKEAMHFSLQDEAMTRMRETIRAAMQQCMAECGLSGSGKGGSKKLGLPSSGKGGAFLGIGEMSAADFEQCFMETLQKLGGPGMSLLGSIFLKKELAEDLGKEALAMAFSMLGGSEIPFSMLKEVDFARAIEQALGEGSRGQTNMKLVEEFMETMRMGLGEDIADWFAEGPLQGDLEQNPYYYNQWAREYLDLVSKIAATPNLLMPNLSKYAKAAKNIRERYLSGKTELGIGKGITGMPEKKEYYSPEQVYLPKNIKKSDTLPVYSPLVKADAHTNAWGGAVRRTQPVVLDGRLNEWQQCKPYALCGSGQGLKELPPELRDCNCLYAQWDNQGFYVAYRIHDTRDNRHRIETFWETDALEIFLDPLNHKDPHRAKGRSFQFWAWPRAPGIHGSTGQSVFSSPQAYLPKVFKKGLIQFASIRNGNQYTCEVFIPALLLERWYPLPGKVVGFNYSINNGEGVLIRWVTNMGRNISLSPDLWGDLLLMGSDAIVKLSPDDFILPGQNVTVTITDHDMNLKSNARDKVWIKVASRLTGDKLPVTCVETGNNSGIFKVEVGTVFALKPKEKDRVSVRPGDILTVYYLDQHGSGGKKNVPLVREINVGRGVFSFKKQ